jgi:hypothetical protein
MSAVTIAGVGTFDLWEGYIVCGNGNHSDPWQSPPGKTWCEHIENLLRKNLDATDGLMDEDMLVPIFPTQLPEPFGFVSVYYTGVEGVWRLCINHPLEVPGVPTDMIDNHKIDRTEGEYLGLCVSFDGRLAMRDMILQWVDSQPESQKTYCRGTSHDFKAEMALQQLKPGSVAAKVSAFSIIYYQRCVRCINQYVSASKIGLVDSPW